VTNATLSATLPTLLPLPLRPFDRGGYVSNSQEVAHRAVGSPRSSIDLGCERAPLTLCSLAVVERARRVPRGDVACGSKKVMTGRWMPVAPLRDASKATVIGDDGDERRVGVGRVIEGIRQVASHPSGGPLAG